jgi:hypothetical protein
LTLVAKKTVYKGHRFASRLEARFACFFDLMGVPWEYEKEAYDLDSLTYIPDFWLSTNRMWHEAKGELITDAIGLKVMEKCKRLAILSGYPVVLAFNDPLAMKCVTFGVQGGMYADSHYSLCPHCGAFGIHVRNEAGPRFICPKKAEHADKPLSLEAGRALHRSLFEAAQAARQRRFGVQ